MYLKKGERMKNKEVWNKILGIPCDICHKPMQPKDVHYIKKGQTWAVEDRTHAMALKDMKICDKCQNKMLHDEEKGLKEFFWFMVGD